MDRTRDFRSRDHSWTVRLTGVAGLLLFGVLFLGAQPGSTAPAAPLGPGELAPPTATLPPKPPKPCVTNPKCLPPLEPCFVAPGHTCQPPTLEPCVKDCQPPTTDPEPPTSQPPTRTPVPQATPTQPPSGIPTPNRIDTGGGPVSPASAPAGSPDWLYWLVPGLAVLVVAGLVTGFWLVRSEARR